MLDPLVDDAAIRTQQHVLLHERGGQLPRCLEISMLAGDSQVHIYSQVHMPELFCVLVIAYTGEKLYEHGSGSRINDSGVRVVVSYYV